ncbi:hypothetical protein STEG23_022595, partial [Scotinomys teguina]
VEGENTLKTEEALQILATLSEHQDGVLLLRKLKNLSAEPEEKTSFDGKPRPSE